MNSPEQEMVKDRAYKCIHQNKKWLKIDHAMHSSEQEKVKDRSYK